jgi:hypothetical protein
LAQLLFTPLYRLNHIVDITMFKIVTFKLLNSYIPSKMVTLVCVSQVFYWFWGTKFGI